LRLTLMEQPHASGELFLAQLAIVIAIESLEQGLGIAHLSGFLRSRRFGSCGPFAARAARRATTGAGTLGRVRPGSFRPTPLAEARTAAAHRRTTGSHTIHRRTTGSHAARRRATSAHRRTAAAHASKRRGSAELFGRDRSIFVLVGPLQHLFDEVRQGIRDFVLGHLSVLVLVQSLQHHPRAGRAETFGFGSPRNPAQGDGRQAGQQHR